MRWSAGDRSNIDDYRGRSGIGGIPIGIGGFVVLLLLSWATGTDFLSFFTNSGAPAGTTGTTGQVQSSPREERQVDFGRYPVDLGAAARQPLPAHARGAVQGCHPVRLRRRAIGDRAVLLSGRSEGLSGSRFLRRARLTVRGAGRLRGGLRHCARIRPSRPESAGDHRSGPRRAVGAKQRIGGNRAAGRLLRRDLGACRLAERTVCRRSRRARAGRRRRGAARCGGDRRRSASTHGDRPSPAGALHARHVAAACRMVPPRYGVGRSAQLRHVLSADALADPGVSACADLRVAKAGRYRRK
jgi:hypothetical protein